MKRNELLLQVFFIHRALIDWYNGLGGKDKYLKEAASLGLMRESSISGYKILETEFYSKIANEYHVSLPQPSMKMQKACPVPIPETRPDSDPAQDNDKDPLDEISLTPIFPRSRRFKKSSVVSDASKYLCIVV